MTVAERLWSAEIGDSVRILHPGSDEPITYSKTTGRGQRGRWTDQGRIANLPDDRIEYHISRATTVEWLYGSGELNCGDEPLKAADCED